MSRRSARAKKTTFTEYFDEDEDEDSFEPSSASVEGEEEEFGEEEAEEAPRSRKGRKAISSSSKKRKASSSAKKSKKKSKSKGKSKKSSGGGAIVISVPAATPPGAAKLKLAAALGAQGPGFFYVKRGALHQERVRALMEAAGRFFAQPEAVKSEIALEHFRGYSRVGEEVTLGLPDWHECIDVLAEQRDPSLPFLGCTKYPRRPEGLRELVEEFTRDMTALCRRVLRGLCDALGLSLQEHFEEPFTILRLLRYPPQPDSPGIGVGEHTDYGCITLVVADQPGLQIRDKEGVWRDISPPPGCVVCNVGDALAKWAGLRATPHRVITRTERTSLAFFFEPSLGASIHLDGHSRYGDYLLHKYTASFPASSTKPHFSEHNPI